MGISASLQNLLNRFALTQPGLQLPGQPAGTNNEANPNLGDVLADMGNDQHRTADCTWDFATNGGAIGTINLQKRIESVQPSGVVITLPILIPAGSIITKVVTDTQVALTSGGSATVAVDVGTDVVVAAQAFGSVTGVQAWSASLPLKSANGGSVQLTIATAALTAGRIRIVVEYLKPQGT